MILLLLADGLSFFLGEWIDATIMLAIILLSGLLGLWQEMGARHILRELLKMVQVTASVIRRGVKRDILVDDLVPGDIVLLSAGDLVSADCRLLQSNALLTNEAMLTGEAFPESKKPGVLSAKTPLKDRENVLFKGTHVVSGSGRALVVWTGRRTEFGKITSTLREARNETDFEKGIRHFGYLLMKVMILFIFLIFAANIYFAKPFIDSLLFSLSLAIGITPFMLPAIISVNLARGARHMARRKVIVKRLVAIENFGSMDVFCSDKTGTLTAGEIQLAATVDVRGLEDERILQAAFLNASFEAGYKNPVDEAIRRKGQMDLSAFQKLDEIPFDFVRKRLTVLLSGNGGPFLVCKGAFDQVLEVCSFVQLGNEVVDIAPHRKMIQGHFERAADCGHRVVAVARKETETPVLAPEDENGMTFLGLLLFLDPVKEGVPESILRLQKAGVTLKVLTGDNKHVTAYLANQLQIKPKKILSGRQLDHLSDEALMNRVQRVHLYAELTPMQKERIVRLLSRSGKVVGFLGDGVNDVSALHAADVGVSVENAVDIAKNTADLILLEKDLGVLTDGLLEGRRTFINTLKYIFMTSSANFGNVFSMALASLFLPFLPLLPKQILASNFITDFPALAIPADRVDDAWLQYPKKWNLPFIRKFMVRFGLLSSGFDLLAFAALLYWLHSTPGEFRSSWFVLTVLTEILVLWTLRTRSFFLHSKPGRGLMLTTALAAGMVLVIPYTFLGEILELQIIPFPHLGLLFLIVLFYTIGNETMKRIFYRRISL